MNDLLDDIIKPDDVKPTGVKYYGILILSYFLGLFIISIVKKFLPTYILGSVSETLLTSNFLALIFIFIFPKVIITSLNKRLLQKSRLKLIAIVFLVILIGDFLYRSYQLLSMPNYTIQASNFNVYLTTAIITPLLSGVMGSFFSWSRINRLRNKSVIIPYIILILLFLLFFGSIYILISLNK